MTKADIITHRSCENGRKPMQTTARHIVPIPQVLARMRRRAAACFTLRRLPNTLARVTSMLGFLAVLLLCSAAQAEGVGPLSIAKTCHFFVGGKDVETKDGPVLAGQAYVEYYIPTNRTHAYPIVMTEGCCLAGAGYMGTPDGRDGWGQYFLSKGYAVYIMDQVGRGRSPYVEAVYGPKSMRTPKSVERDFIAYEKYNLFPQAKL